MAEPLYRQIAQDLMRKINLGLLDPSEDGVLPQGALPPGTQLPNEDALKEEYKASRNTVRAAIDWLAIRNLVVTRPGLGTFVAERRPEPFVTTLSEDSDPEAGMAGGEGKTAFNEIIGRQLQQIKQERSEAGLPPLSEEEEKWSLENLPWGKPDAKDPTVEVKAVPDWVAERLRMKANDVVIVRHQEFFIGSIPWSLQTTFYPMSLVQRGATDLLMPNDIKQGTIQYLREQGLIQCGSRLRILVRAPNENEARFFGLPDDGRIPVVSLIRTGYENKGKAGLHPFRVTFTILPADRNQFVVNRGKVPKELAKPARDQ